MMMMHGGWVEAWPWFALWVAFKITVWSLVITGVIFAVRRLRREGCVGRLSTPLEILKTRYARGELSREEFDAMRRELQSS